MVVADHRSSPRSLRILVVEDDALLRFAVAADLRMRGFHVTEADSGIAFFKALRSGTFDVAVLDINLPDSSGYDLARELAKEQRCGIVLLTGRSGRADRIAGYAAGADVYLTKPVDSEELFLAIQNLGRRLRRNGQKGGAATVFPEEQPGWRLDLTRGSLIAPGGISIPLSGRETLLMQHLAESQLGKTVRRAALIELLGYEKMHPESRSLDAVLRRLRKKAAALDIVLPLHSVHAMGIRFTAPISYA